MTNQFKKELLELHKHCPKCPSNEQVVHWFEELLALLYPAFSNHKLTTEQQLDNAIESIRQQLNEIFEHFPNTCPERAKTATQDFFDELPRLKQVMDQDLEAIFSGDPAAKSKQEVVRSYPGFYAIAAYRIAHNLFLLGVEILPRIITEYAHHRTGIDIHPAATIGNYFCIDHGTGVVIGETTVIGNWVKIYQGVTLGALSVEKKDANTKRHPTIEDGVVVYANTTILGGKTIIGKESIIGGNVWITKSVAPFSTVYYIAGDNQIQKKVIDEH